MPPEGLAGQPQSLSWSYYLLPTTYYLLPPTLLLPQKQRPRPKQRADIEAAEDQAGEGAGGSLAARVQGGDGVADAQGGDEHVGGEDEEDHEGKHYRRLAAGQLEYAQGGQAAQLGGAAQDHR